MSLLARSLRSVAAAWPALLLLAGGELLLAGFAAAPAGFALASLARRPALAELAAGDWLSVLVEAGSAMPTLSPAQAEALGGALGPTPETGAISSAAVLSLVAVPLALSLHALLYTFASGAALEHMARPPAGLWPAGAAWFWPFLRLGLLLVVATVLFGGLGAVALALLPGSGDAGTPLKLFIFLVLLGAIGSLLELTRATMVAGRRRSAPQSLRRALQTVIDRPLAVAALWLALGLGNLGHAALIGTLTLAVSAANPWAAWPVTILAIATGTAYKLFRLAAQLHLLK